jgi:hypothetical protein
MPEEANPCGRRQGISARWSDSDRCSSNGKYFGFIKCRARNVREWAGNRGVKWLPLVNVNPF